MKSVADIEARINELRSIEDSLRRYLSDVVMPRDDLHGIMDCSADLREVVAERSVLEWVITVELPSH